ncbi:50S ribosome-binding GTPase [Patescibacteria group bacterium]|nr:50S ribosome-binding GTPase [Patescibacteria group bacterium]
MASTNQSPQYQKAEGMYLQARNDEERLRYLEEMIRECPKHKSSEKMLAQLKTRKKKLLEKINKIKKRGKGKKEGIKKEDLQAVIVGFTNTGKSSLISILTNASPEITPYHFTTKKPVIGMLNYEGTPIQIIEVPSFESEYYDRGVVNTADLIIILVTSLEQIERIKEDLKNAHGKKLVVFNLQGFEDERKINATLQSKRYNFMSISTKNGKGIEDLKEKIFQNFEKIRIFTKEPGKGKSQKPIILDSGTTIKEIAERILKNVKEIKEIKIWGPSSKFPGQRVGIKHILKDLDVVEFKTY